MNSTPYHNYIDSLSVCKVCGKDTTFSVSIRDDYSLANVQYKTIYKSMYGNEFKFSHVLDIVNKCDRFIPTEFCIDSKCEEDKKDHKIRIYGGYVSLSNFKPESDELSIARMRCILNKYSLSIHYRQDRLTVHDYRSNKNILTTTIPDALLDPHSIKINESKVDTILKTQILL